MVKRRYVTNLLDIIPYRDELVAWADLEPEPLEPVTTFTEAGVIFTTIDNTPFTLNIVKNRVPTFPKRFLYVRP